MKKKKQKYYVVWKGVNPGIYNDWETAKAQVDGIEGAKYKSFENKDLAIEAYKGNPYEYIGKNKEDDVKKQSSSKKETHFIEYSICVDAACAGNPGNMEYQGVETKTRKQIFHVGPLKMGTNNVGEFLGLVHACALLKQKKYTDMVIYTDSKIAMKWVKDKNPKTKLERVPQNKEIFDLLERAVLWLRNNTIENKILHWNTEAWGEILADFGRK